MAVDLKYGKVTTEFGSIGEDEPVVVFRARDANLNMLLAIYGAMCKAVGSPPHHLDLIEQTRAEVADWQSRNIELVRIPNSNTYMGRIGK